MFLLKWFSKRTYGPMTSKEIQVLERTVVGRDALLMLVRVGTRTLLLSSTKEGVSLLRDMTEAEPTEQPLPQLAELPTVTEPPKIEIPPPEIAEEVTAVSGLSFMESYDNAINAIKDRGEVAEAEDKPVTVALKSAAATYAGAARPKPKAPEEPRVPEEIPLVKIPPPAVPPPKSGDDKLDEMLEKVRQRNARYNKKK
ncbi:hypothetical protein FACS18949_15810 [Clostridia bacterium]|nr:hypothetical protein FACS18949_15810 [Clostridia bacterium]